MSTVHILKKIDPNQLFRLFVDGRFHKKYKGWVGYEAGEKGSIQALLNGLSYMLDNFYLTNGLKSTYLLDLHKVCMSGVETKNPKSSPGDLRFLNSGMPFFKKTTTYENIVEILELRKGDGTNVFNTKGFDKPAENLDAEEVFNAIQTKGRLNYRNWYPNLTAEQIRNLNKENGLIDFYKEKNKVQMLFAEKVEDIVSKFNKKILNTKDQEEQLRSIALVVRELELLHLFSDGNCRTLACILLNQLLMNYNFYPTFLLNPNLDGEYSLEQWVQEIKNGMEMVMKIIDEPEAPVYNFSINESLAADRAVFLKMAAVAANKIKNFKEIHLNSENLEKYTKGHWENEQPYSLGFTGVGTYNTYSKGNIYFALELDEWKKKGENSVKLLKSICSKGVRALVVDDRSISKNFDIPVYYVENVNKAFINVAKGVRKDLNPLTVLITGTEGKTGAKVQLNHVLKKQINTHAVINSANTGIPILRSLAGLGVDDKVEINEVSVGSNERIRVSNARHVSPDVCLFTNIGQNHMDLHKSIESIIWAKSSVVVDLQDDGYCIVDSDNEFSDELIEAILKRRVDAKIYTYGTSSKCTGQLLGSSFSEENSGWNITARIKDKTLDYFLPLIQNHAPLASVGILLAVELIGLDVFFAAEEFRTLKPYQTMGALETIKTDSKEILFYDQSRRGGISGVRSAFNDLENIKGSRRVVALVGGISVMRDSEWTKESHTELGQLINKAGIGRLYTTGNYIEYVHDTLNNKPVLTSGDIDELSIKISQDLKDGDLLFIIGSAYLYLGRAADKIKNLLRNEEALNDKIIVGEDSQFIDRWKLLKAYRDYQYGDGIIKSATTHGLKHEEFRASLRDIPDYIDYRTKIILDFFTYIKTEISDRFGFLNVNDKMQDGRSKNYLLSKSFCRRWLNNFDKLTSVNSKQLIGDFYYIGSERFLLHIELATNNMHAGLVEYKYEGDVIEIVASDASNIEDIYPDLSKFNITHRNWGAKWYSVDLGDHINILEPEVFLSLVDYENSKACETIIQLSKYLSDINKV